MTPVCRHCGAPIEYWLEWVHTDTMDAPCLPVFGEHFASPTTTGCRSYDTPS